MVAHHNLLELPEIRDPRGMLTFAQGNHLPFEVKRLFALYDVPAGAVRGGHAHKTQHQLLFVMGGAARIIIDNGRSRQDLIVDRPCKALHAPPMLWLEVTDFTPGAVCAVLTSADYDDGDYIRDHAHFLTLVG